MEIGEIVRLLSLSFVVLEASWPSDQGMRLISEIAPSHVIIRSGESPFIRYYMFTSDQVVSHLQTRRSEISHILDLNEADAVPLVPATESDERVPDRCVVHEEGIIVGIFDAGSRKADIQHRQQTVVQFAVEGELVTHELLTNFPEKIELGTSISLIVCITVTGTAGSPPIALPVGTMVDIVVQPKRGLEIDGRAEACLKIEEKETLPAQFKVRGTTIGSGKLRVLAFHQGKVLGDVTLAPAVVPAAGLTATDRVERSRALAPVSVRVPDVMLLIEQTQAGIKPAFNMRLSAPYLDKPHNLTKFGPITLETDPVKYFADFFKGIEDQSLDSRDGRAIAVEQLRSKGAALFERLFPPELQRILWDLRTRNLALLIQSEEPCIPWELCRLCGEVDGSVEDGPFLCEAFAVTRWQPGIAFKAPLRLTNMALVVPRDSGLSLAPVERTAILGLASTSRKITLIPANFLELQRALASGEYNAWHFTGHGADPTIDPNKAKILLEEKQTFTPDNLAGQVRNLGHARPIVFLNACQTGRGGMSLTGIGGWAREFLKAGAGVFIGTYWSVFDQPACEFSQALYARLLNGEPIGKAVQGARAAIQNSRDPTWLAYTVFADPLMILEDFESQPPRR